MDITLRKETPHKQWENLGSYLPGHGQLITKNKRGMSRGKETERKEGRWEGGGGGGGGGRMGRGGGGGGGEDGEREGGIVGEGINRKRIFCQVYLDWDGFSQSTKLAGVFQFVCKRGDECLHMKVL